MRCAKVVRSLPLYVGRDLDAGRSGEISAHLARCERCRALEAGLRESRAWLESAPPPPLHESDYSAVRHDVWQRIEAESVVAEKRPPHTRRLVLAGGLLAGALLAVFLSVHPRPEVPHPGAPRLAASPVMTTALEPVVAAETSSEPAPIPLIRSAARARVRQAAPAARASVVKIEFQTANPGVRIIWLVKKGDGVPTSAAGRNQEVS